MMLKKLKLKIKELNTLGTETKQITIFIFSIRNILNFQKK
jgi:hypothetical protein